MTTHEYLFMIDLVNRSYRRKIVYQVLKLIISITLGTIFCVLLGSYNYHEMTLLALVVLMASCLFWALGIIVFSPKSYNLKKQRLLTLKNSREIDLNDLRGDADFFEFFGKTSKLFL